MCMKWVTDLYPVTTTLPHHTMGQSPTTHTYKYLYFHVLCSNSRGPFMWDYHKSTYYGIDTYLLASCWICAVLSLLRWWWEGGESCVCFHWPVDICRAPADIPSSHMRQIPTVYGRVREGRKRQSEGSKTNFWARVWLVQAKSRHAVIPYSRYAFTCPVMLWLVKAMVPAVCKQETNTSVWAFHSRPHCQHVTSIWSRSSADIPSSHMRQIPTVYGRVGVTSTHDLGMYHVSSAPGIHVCTAVMYILPTGWKVRHNTWQEQMRCANEQSSKQ